MHRILAWIVLRRGRLVRAWTQAGTKNGLLASWFTYGAEGAERWFRLLIAAIALFGLLGLIFNVPFFFLPGKYVSAVQQVLLDLEAQPYAYAMAGACGMLAAACVTFIALLLSTATNSTRHHLTDARAGTVASLMVALLSAGMATMTFAGVYALQQTAHLAQVIWQMQLAGAIQLMTSSIVVIFAVAILIDESPAAKYTSEVVRVLSFYWIIFGGVLFFFGYAAPIGHRAIARPFWFLLLLTTGQIALPHGWLRLKWGEKRYRDCLDQFRYAANTLFSWTAVAASAVFLISLLQDVRPGEILWQPTDERWVCVLIWFIFAPWGAGLLCFQMWIEGTRKFRRYPQWPVPADASEGNSQQRISTTQPHSPTIPHEGASGVPRRARRAGRRGTRPARGRSGRNT